MGYIMCVVCTMECMEYFLPACHDLTYHLACDNVVCIYRHCRWYVIRMYSRAVFQCDYLNT